MAPLQLSTAELGNRLRRAFGIRGAIDTAVDTLASPVALAVDLDAPPFRGDGVSWYGALRQITGATFGNVGVYADASVRATVDGVLVTNIDAATQDFRIAVINVIAAGLGTIAPELIGGPSVPLAPVTVFAIDLVAAATPVMHRFRLGAGENIWIPLDTALTPDPNVSTQTRVIAVGADTAGVDVQASFSGRFWYGGYDR